MNIERQNTLNLTTLIEGLYDSGTNTMISDTVNIYLRNNVSPFAVVDFAKGNLSSSGTATFTFTNAISGSSYYLQLAHRTALETWSKTAQIFGASGLTYNFTTDSAKAYGNNLRIDGSRWTLYNGDADQNGVIELSDVLLIYNDASVFAAGYINTDMNGDNLADLEDILIAYNNSTDFVSVSHP